MKLLRDSIRIYSFQPLQNSMIFQDFQEKFRYTWLFTLFLPQIKAYKHFTHGPDLQSNKPQNREHCFPPEFLHFLQNVYQLTKINDLPYSETFSYISKFSRSGNPALTQIQTFNSSIFNLTFCNNPSDAELRQHTDKF